jgi:hypothetical protein
MKRLLARLKKIFGRSGYVEELEQIKDEKLKLDMRIQQLERKATMNGEDGWFLEYVKKDPSCALRVLRECDKNGNI